MNIIIVKKSICVLTVNILLLGCIQARKACIIVPGTWSSAQTWHQEGGDFFTNIKNKSIDTVFTFTWNGKNDHHERIRAAQQLAHSMEKWDTVTLITHSHGGNVALLACTLLHEKNVATRVDRFYSLATPVSSAYPPPMDKIEYLYHLFSFGDVIQPVLGIFGRTFAPHERIANIQVICNNILPTHSQLHSPLIAQWLFSLPQCYCDTIVHFSLLQSPQYTQDTTRQDDLEQDILFHRELASAFDRSWKEDHE